MKINDCLISKDDCAKYFESQNGGYIKTSSVPVMGNTINIKCNQGYNYLSKKEIGDLVANKGYVPAAARASNQGYLSIDTSTGCKYSDYVSSLTPGVAFKNFWRINMNKNFRFYFRIYYDYEIQPNKTVFANKYSSKPTANISATINLDNGVSQTAFTQINIKSSRNLNS
jgi:hypothetical protein